MEIKVMKLADLQPAEYNPRKKLTEDDVSYQRIKASIETFGMVEPVVWNQRTGNLIAGHQRLQVLEDMGTMEIEVSVVDLAENNEKALNLALNKITGEWDESKLSEVLSELASAGDIDLNDIGFNEEEFRSIIGEAEQALAVQNLKNREVDLGDYEGKNFSHICPRCGFAFD